MGERKTLYGVTIQGKPPSEKNKNIVHAGDIFIIMMPHRSLCVRGLQHLGAAIHYGILLLYIGQKMPLVPLTDHTPTKLTRNQEMRERYAQGETIADLAQAFAISTQRVSQVLSGQRK
jgi:Mor family transcriptional regulator